MIKFSIFWFLLLLPPNRAMDVYYIPGGLDDYLKMTRHPGDADLNELSMCMRSGKSIFCISNVLVVGFTPLSCPRGELGTW